MTKDQNDCMKSKFNADDAEALYKFIALSKLSANKEEVATKNEKLRTLLFRTISNVIECTEVLNMSNVVDNLLPSIDAETAE